MFSTDLPLARNIPWFCVFGLKLNNKLYLPVLVQVCILSNQYSLIYLQSIRSFYMHVFQSIDICVVSFFRRPFKIASNGQRGFCIYITLLTLMHTHTHPHTHTQFKVYLFSTNIWVRHIVPYYGLKIIHLTCRICSSFSATSKTSQTFRRKPLLCATTVFYCCTYSFIFADYSYFWGI